MRARRRRRIPPWLAALFVAGCRGPSYVKPTTEDRIRFRLAQLGEVRSEARAAWWRSRSFRADWQAARRRPPEERSRHDGPGPEFGVFAVLPKDERFDRGTGLEVGWTMPWAVERHGVRAHSFLAGWARYDEGGGTRDVFRYGWRFWRSFSRSETAAPVLYMGCEFGGISEARADGNPGGGYAHAFLGLATTEGGRGAHLRAGYLAADPGGDPLGGAVIALGILF